METWICVHLINALKMFPKQYPETISWVRVCFREFIQFGDGWLYSRVDLARADKTSALGGFCARCTGVIMVLHVGCAVSGNRQKATIITTVSTIFIIKKMTTIFIIKKMTTIFIIILIMSHLHQLCVNFPKFSLQQLVLLILLVQKHSSVIYFTLANQIQFNLIENLI